ncbi:MAG: acyl-CoA dehydrogenase C-terminal domain-containing protein [Gammaproteobacteria bacterium]|nr:acyl-CoA dehydrogenase C-terminal domain-containing protein [Gammaproteobacteria bacterium]
MLSYSPPLADMEFVLFEVFDAETEWARMPALKDTDKALAVAVLGEAGRVAREVMAPLYQASDAEGAHWRDGAVSAPAGFKEAFKALAEGGWFGVAGNAEHGGQGLPKLLTVPLEEMLWGANVNLYLYGALTVGAAVCIDTHGDQAMKRAYLPKLYSAEWTGAMALTESHAGTDLGMIRTRAEPAADATYEITGTKIFITSGEHDVADNIVHLVLAKLPDAPQGSRGISLFLVPKILPDGARNTFASGSIEHKMGIRGSATSVINYDAATGYLVGAPNGGLANMFTMMNHARLSVGIQGLGLGELAYQNAVAYARERLQGRAASGPSNPDAPADSILVHPDVRRMLLTQRALTEGGRAFAAFVGLLLDRATYAADPGERDLAQASVDLLTPVVKAFLTDRGLEGAVLAQQVFGGHGYIVEHGMEQIVRDARIAQIYEGTNGVQALDFTARKVLRDGGSTLRRLLGEMADDPVPAEFSGPMADAFAAIESATAHLLAGARSDPDLPGAISADFLELTGLGIYAWLWARMAQLDVDLRRNKMDVARFFYAKLLPKTRALLASIEAGAESVMALPEEAF